MATWSKAGLYQNAKSASYFPIDSKACTRKGFREILKIDKFYLQVLDQDE